MIAEPNTYLIPRWLLFIFRLLQKPPIRSQLQPYIVRLYDQDPPFFSHSYSTCILQIFLLCFSLSKRCLIFDICKFYSSAITQTSQLSLVCLWLSQVHFEGYLSVVNPFIDIISVVDTEFWALGSAVKSDRSLFVSYWSTLIIVFYRTILLHSPFLNRYSLLDNSYLPNTPLIPPVRLLFLSPPLPFSMWCTGRWFYNIQ